MPSKVECSDRARGFVEFVGGGGSAGRFHFVSLPACGGAIAAALCQSVTLSRHPFSLPIARGFHHTPLHRAPGGAGTTWIKAGVA